jgi:hypothetical protein
MARVQTFCCPQTGLCFISDEDIDYSKISDLNSLGFMVVLSKFNVGER